MNQKLYKLFKMLAKFETVSTVDNLTLELPNGLNVDSEVFVENEEGELVPIQDGEYQIGDVTIVVVGGIIAEIKQTDINEPIEEPTEEPETLETEEPTTEEPETNEVEKLKQKVAELEEENTQLKAKIADLEAKLSEPIEEPIEDVFKAVEPKNEPKIDFTKYINRK
jgi:predicted RNase H-like nuclease (RuvC/YqgF family)